MREYRDLTISDKHTQSSRDSSTISISDNSTTRKSIPGIMTDTPSTPTTFPVETDATEIPEEIQAQSNRSVMPTDIQALTVLQGLVSDDFKQRIHILLKEREKRLQIHVQIYKMKHSN